MPLKTQQLETPSLNLTPMIDVVFNLMIFFMAGTQFVEMERQIEISLPQVQHEQPLTPAPTKKIVQMLADGTYMLGTNRLPLADITRQLALARQASPDLRVVVRGDRLRSLQSLGEVLDAIKAAHIDDIDLAVETR